MFKQEKGATPIFILVVLVVLLFIVGVAVNILISDEGVIRQTRKTVQIGQEPNEELKIETIDQNEIKK